MKESVYLVAYILKIPFKFELSRKYNTDNEFLNLKDVKVQSQIEYLSEYGIVISQPSKQQTEAFNIILYAKNIKNATKAINTFDNDSVEAKKKELRSIFHPSSMLFDYDKSPSKLGYFQINNPVFPSTQVTSSFTSLDRPIKLKPMFYFLQDNNMALQNNNDAFEFSISDFSFFLLKHLFSVNGNHQLIFHYSEIEKTPLLIQLLVHLPLIVLFLSIFVLVAWFESGTGEDVIENEISKLPLQKYNRLLPFSECSICLDCFDESQDVRVLGCKHCFHQNCIDHWLRNMLRCPICRTSVSKLAESSSYQIYQTFNTR